VAVVHEPHSQHSAGGTGVGALSQTEVDDLLELAGTAAHAFERTAAPLSCWMAASSGLTTAEALALARDVAESLRPT